MPESYLSKRKYLREILRGFEECKIWRHSANALTIMVGGVPVDVWTICYHVFLYVYQFVADYRSKPC